MQRVRTIGLSAEGNPQVVATLGSSTRTRSGGRSIVFIVARRGDPDEVHTRIEIHSNQGVFAEIVIVLGDEIDVTTGKNNRRVSDISIADACGPISLEQVDLDEAASRRVVVQSAEEFIESRFAADRRVQVDRDRIGECIDDRLGADTAVRARDEDQKVVALLAGLDCGELDFDSAAGSHVRNSAGLGLFVQSQSSIEWTAVLESLGQGFDDQGTLAGLPVGSKVDIEAIQIDVAAFGSVQVACAEHIEVAWEDRFEVSIGAGREVDKASVEVHQSRGIGIAGSGQTEHQSDASHRGPSEVLSVVVVPGVVGREDR